MMEQTPNPDSGTPPEAASRTPKATGPRTKLGKQTASRNAIKHPLFSKAVVVKSESRAEYERLLAGFRESLQPEGAFEELLVVKLVITAWRYRRLLLAEVAIIQKNTEFFEWDQQDPTAQGRTAEQILIDAIYNPGGPGLITKIQDPVVLSYCLQLLSELRAEIERRGFDPGKDTDSLKQIYGVLDPNRKNLYYLYEEWFETSKVSKEERESEGRGSPEQCKDWILCAIANEIRRLEEQNAMEMRRKELEVKSRSVPDLLLCNYIITYETNLDRTFDRTLSQLERFQRIRRGQPVPPELNVRVTQDPLMES